MPRRKRWRPFPRVSSLSSLLLERVPFQLVSIMGNPRTVEGFLDAAVSGLDDLAGNGADKRIECLCADGVQHAFADFLRVKSSRCRRSAKTASSSVRTCGPPICSGRLRAPRGIFVLIKPTQSTE